MSREWFQIAADHRERLQAHGLASFDALMEEKIGILLFKKDDGSEVRRFDFPDGGGSLFLKRRSVESLRPQLALFSRTGKFHSGPVRECMMAGRLRDAGFSVMEPVAWGERRCWGIPRGGFFISLGIPGTSLANVFEGSRGTERLQMMRRLGVLNGRLHAKGFLHPLRLKDVIEAPDGQWFLIDRETSSPWPKRFSQAAALAVLARSARRTMRDGHRPGGGSAFQFLRGYRQGVAGVWDPSTRELRKRFMRQLRLELS